MKMLRILGVVALGTGLLAAPMLDDAWARAGGGRSFGGGGRRYSAPTRPYSAPSAPYSPSTPRQPYPGSMPGSPYSQPGGGFWRSLGGGLLGGMLGGMLFRSLGFGGVGGLGGGGFGLMDLLLLAGIGYLIFTFVRRSRVAERREPAPYVREPEEQPWSYAGQPGAGVAAPSDAEGGLFAIRQADPGFDEESFREWCTDTFFRVQACWMRRDLEGLRPFLTPETYDIFRRDIEELRTKGQTNRLENITVRSVDLVEAWQEQGRDCVTVRYVANLLDYTVEDGTERIVSGSDREPVKFQEFWTWARPTGPNAWRLAGIQQVD